MKYYVGVKNNYHCDIFRSKELPVKSTHGHKYNFCFGGYPTIKKAVQVAMYQNYGIDTPQGKSIKV